MATRWLKLTGSAATKFNAQYQDMLAKNEVTEAEFPPDMFVEFMLDIREKAQGLKKGESDGGQEPSHP